MHFSVDFNVANFRMFRILNAKSRGINILIFIVVVYQR